jgi:hypothetical protein
MAWCNPNRTNDGSHWFDGWSHEIGSTVGGVYGNLSLYDPYVNSVDTSVWVMLENGSSYAQIGYLAKVGSPGPETGFTEYQDNGPFGFDYHEFPMPTLWSAEFKVLYGNTSGKFTFYANGVLERDHCQCFTPTGGQNFSELQSKSDQMFGQASNHERMWNMHLYWSGAWHNFSGTASDDGQTSNWAFSVVNTQEIQIWDKCQ